MIKKVLFMSPYIGCLKDIVSKTLYNRTCNSIVTSKPRKFFFSERKNWEGGGYGKTYSEIMSRRYTHRGACCESNALLWFRIMGQRPKRML